MLKKSTLNIYLFAVLSIIYYLLNIIFPTDFSADSDNVNRIWPQTAGAILAVFCTSVLALNLHRVLDNKILKLFVAFLVLAVLYIPYPFNIVDNCSFFMRSYMAIIYMLAFYVIISYTPNSGLWKKCVFVVFAFQIVYCFFTLIHDYVSTSMIKEDGFDSNSGFTLVTCIPMALLFPKKRMRIYLYLMLVIGCVFSGQRSAALSSILSFPLCIKYLKSDFCAKDFLVITMLFIFLGLPVLENAFDNIAYRNSYDVDNGNFGSGRLTFWGIVLKSFFDGDILHIVFGNGTNTVALLLESKYGIAIGAHNGWLDIMYSFGIIGLLLYSAVIFSLVVRSNQFKHNYPKFRLLYLIAFVIFFVRCSTSHGYFDISMMPFCLAIAIVEHNVDVSKRSIAVLSKAIS